MHKMHLKYIEYCLAVQLDPHSFLQAAHVILFSPQNSVTSFKLTNWRLLLLTSFRTHFIMVPRCKTSDEDRARIIEAYEDGGLYYISKQPPREKYHSILYWAFRHAVRYSFVFTSSNCDWLNHITCFISTNKLVFAKNKWWMNCTLQGSIVAHHREDGR